MKVTPNWFLIKSTVVGALGGLLFGFDTAVIAGTTRAITNEYNLSPEALGFTVSSALWGTVASSMSAGLPGERYGSRETLRIAAVLYVLSAIGCALAWNLESLVFFRFIGGLGIGCSSVLGPVYISEIAPASWRGRLVGVFQVNVVLGILLAYLSNFLIGTMSLGALEWRWKLGVSALPAVLFLIMLFTIPRSPRWLVARNHVDEARSVLRMIDRNNFEKELHDIIVNLSVAHKQSSERLFSPKYKFPLFLAIAIGTFNQLSGINAILYYLNDIFAAAGFSKLSSDVQAVIIGGTNLICCLLAMSLIDRLGRRTLLLIGSIGTGLCMAGVAAVFFLQQNLPALLWLLILYIGFFSFSQGAVIWVYISEIFPTPVRAKGQSVGSSAHWIMNALISGVFPLLAKSSGGAPFAFFSVMMFLQFLVVWRYFPETKGVSLEDMEHKLGISQVKSNASAS